jgi:hypothetical protein
MIHEQNKTLFFAKLTALVNNACIFIDWKRFRFFQLERNSMYSGSIPHILIIVLNLSVLQFLGPGFYINMGIEVEFAISLFHSLTIDKLLEQSYF